MAALYRKNFLFACTVLLGITLLSAATAVAGPTPKCKLDVPTVTCIGSTPSSITLQICAGASGAPGGISIHWSTCAQYAANGNTIPDPSGGGFAISLSGNCQQSGSTWNLASGRCKTIVINGNTLVTAAAEGCGSSGNTADLACATCYVFQVFAHEDPGVCNKSDLSAAQFCNTAPCPEGNCTLTWGFWKTHGPAGCNPPGKDNLWPVSTLTIGGSTLSQSDLCSILQTNPGACAKAGSSNGGANAVIILEHQLIAAMFNVASGAISCNFADAAITQSNSILTGFESACVGTSTPLGQNMVALASVLETYNSDQCACPVQQTKPQASPNAPSNARRSSWGGLKSFYH
jgi:hypothetical protein